MQAPKPLSSCKDLEIQEVPEKLVAVLPTRGFGSDRGALTIEPQEGLNRALIEP
jgi:hypothetical protein